MVVKPLENFALLAFGVFLLRRSVALASVMDAGEMGEAPATPRAARVRAG